MQLVALTEAEKAEYNRLSDMTMEAAAEVLRNLGSGFLEKVYERALARELAIRSIPSRSQVAMPVYYKGVLVGEYFADLLVDQKLVVEVKRASEIGVEHVAQCLNYLKASGNRLGLILNFGKPTLGWRRVAHHF